MERKHKKSFKGGGCWNRKLAEVHPEEEARRKVNADSTSVSNHRLLIVDLAGRRSKAGTDARYVRKL